MNEKGFTLIEMLVVLLVISVLLLLIIPNIGKQHDSIETKGCLALQKMVQSNVESYRIEHELLPDNLQVLKDEGYISSYKCKNNVELTYDKTSGTVSIP